MADLNQDESKHTIYGYSTQEQAFIETISTKIAPFYLAIDQVDEVLNQYIDPEGEISYTLNPLNEQAQTQPLTGPLNCNGKRIENIGVVQDMTSIEAIQSSGGTAVNVNTMATYIQLFSELNLILANPLIQTALQCKQLPLKNVGDASLPLPTDTQQILDEKFKNVLTLGQSLDTSISRLNVLREEPPGQFSYNNVFDAKQRQLQNLLAATKDGDAANWGQIKQKFLEKDGATIDMISKRCINGQPAIDSNDLVIKQQLDDVENELQDLINNIGGIDGGSLLDIISLAASLTSLAASLYSLGFPNVGTLLGSIGSLAAPISSILALASILKDGAGNIIQSSSLKLASDIDNYAPDPQNPLQNWAEQQADIDRLRQGQTDIENSASRPAGSIGSSWVNSMFQAPLMAQRQLLNAFELVA